MKKIRTNQGIIGWIILVVAAIIILGYFGFDLRRIIESPQVQQNLQYAWDWVKGPILWVWEFIKAVWEAIERFVTGFESSVQEFAPDTRLEQYEAQLEE